MLTITDVEWFAGRCNSMTVAESHLVKITRAAVEQKINQHLAQKAIPENWHELCSNFGEVLTEKADILLYPTKKQLDQAQEIFEGLTDAIAILAFVKGGVELFGTRYEAAFDGSSET